MAGLTYLAAQIQSFDTSNLACLSGECLIIDICPSENTELWK